MRTKWIGWALLVMVVVLIIVINILCAELSPQHAEFIRVFFVELPVAIFKTWFSAFI